MVTDGVNQVRIHDFGMVQMMAFADPDGMECELALSKEGTILTMAERRVEEYDAT